MVWEIVVVLVLTIANGFFSMSEIALVTVRKTRISSLSKLGNSRAKVVQVLQQSPESLFATIQIGISIITIAASAFAGSSIAQQLAVYFSHSRIYFLEQHSYSLSFALVVLILAYVNISIGELIPKSLGLRYAEPIALWAAYPVWWLSKISFVLIKVLNVSSNLFLKIFKDSTNFTESRLSEEEIRSLISEGKKAGTIEAHEHSIIQNVFDFSDLSVGKIMVPRTQMSAFDIKLPAKEIIHKSIESGYSRIPVYEKSPNNVVGILYTKRLLARFDQHDEKLDIKDYLVPAYFVPESMKISSVLQRLQKRKAHMALVTDEHGEIAGLVTLEDVLEEIVGDITDETDETERLVKREGEDSVIEGDVSIVDFNKHFRTELPENEDYSTLSGFILEKLGRFPKEADVVEYGDLKITVKEANLRTVKTAIIEQKRST